MKIQQLKVNHLFLSLLITQQKMVFQTIMSSVFFRIMMRIFGLGQVAGGVAKFDGKYFTTYTEEEGLSNNNVLSITQDKNDNLWFGTRFGLSKLKSGALNVNANNTGLPLFNNFEYEDGFLGIGCNRGAICQDNAGTIWIGTNDRLTAYHGDGDIADTISPEIQLTGISLFNEKDKMVKSAFRYH